MRGDDYEFRSFWFAFVAIVSIMTALFFHEAVSACEGIDRLLNFNPWQFLSQPEKAEFIPRVAFDSAHSFDALHYDIFLDVPYTSGNFGGWVGLKGMANQAGLDEISLHMMHLTADSVKSDSGIPLTFVRGDSSLTVNLPSAINEGDTFNFRVYFHDVAQQRGFYYYVRNSYTMAEPYDARWWFPCFDEPWDKATADIRCRVPMGIEVAANGNLVAIDTSGGSITYHYNMPYAITTYLICLGVGDYTVWSVNIPDGLGDSIPCTYFVYPEDSSLANYDFATVPAMMDAFNLYFGPYPFDSYGMVAVQPFQFGGMEHQTMTTINRSWVNGNRASEYGIAHELAHQWWGDLVTMSDFRHIWLNEGFATYAECLYAEHRFGFQAYQNRIAIYQNNYFYYDEHVGRFPLFDPDYYFNLAEYLKGALVLHMLRGIIGDDDFFASLLHYADLYRFGNASTEDFRDAVESIAGVDLDYFFHQWIYEQGYPEYIYSYNWAPHGQGWRLNLDISQVQTNSPLFSMPIQVLVEGTAADTLVTVFNSQAAESYQIDLNFEPNNLVFDPGNWIVKRAYQGSTVGDETAKPKSIVLGYNYPNPFNSTTSFNVYLPYAGQTEIQVFDIAGRLVKTIFSGWLESGSHFYSWDGTDRNGEIVATGIYFYRLSHDNRSTIRSMTLLK